MARKGERGPWNEPFRNVPSHKEIVASVVEELGLAEETSWIQAGLSGWPDIVTDSHIYEVKPLLTMSAVHRGVGQLLMYDLDWPGRKLVLVGHEDTGAKLKPYVEKLGVQMRILSDLIPEAIKVAMPE